MTKPASLSRALDGLDGVPTSQFNIENADVQQIVEEMKRVVRRGQELKQYHQLLRERLEEITPTTTPVERARIKLIEENIARSGSRIVTERARILEGRRQTHATALEDAIDHATAFAAKKYKLESLPARSKHLIELAAKKKFNSLDLSARNRRNRRTHSK